MSYYRIRNHLGQIVVRKVEDTGFGPALHPDDQAFADAIVAEVQEACQYFYQADPAHYPGCPEIDGITDDEVRERIARLDEGENRREAERTKLLRYPLSDLPWDRQRALIERVERLKRQWNFERLSDEEGAALYKEPQHTSRGFPYYSWV